MDDIKGRLELKSFMVVTIKSFRLLIGYEIACKVTNWLLQLLHINNDV